MTRPTARILTLGPMPPEKLAFALARYSRSPDSIEQSLDWVRERSAQRFLESFYFQYGHASIADLGHLAICFEGISEVAAIEIEDEQLWDGQARSSRYQDFSRSGFVTPPELDGAQTERYEAAARRLIEGYQQVHARVFELFTRKLPRPAEMAEDAYRRNLTARAFDVARYLLPLGIPTGVGQVTSIRTLERQIRRWRAAECAELRALGEATAAACAAAPECRYRPEDPAEAVAPTLAKYVEADPYPPSARAAVRQWAAAHLPAPAGAAAEKVDLLRPAEPLAEIAATLLYPVTERPFRELYGLAAGWSRARQAEVLAAALRERTKRDELLREFRTGTFAYDMTIDIGAYRDMHRHRRCQQFRQPFTAALGYEMPEAVEEAGAAATFREAYAQALEAAAALPAVAAQYLYPFATRSRFLFKMDFAEAEYIAKLRSGVKGHFSYRDIAWRMKTKMDELEPELGRLIDATPPWVEDPLVR